MNRYHRIMALLLCLVLALPVSAQAEDDAYKPLREQISSQTEHLVTWNNDSDVPLYADYLAAHADAGDYAGEEIVATRVEGDAFVVQAPQDGCYNIAVTFAPADSEEVDAQRVLIIDGAAAFQESQSVMFRWWWMDAHEPIRNAAGDEVHPTQKRLDAAQRICLSDANGYHAGAFRFFLTQGEHRIEFVKVVQEVDIQTVSLAAPQQIPCYADVAENFEPAMIVRDGIVFEAEKAVAFKNSASIKRIASDDPMASPFEFGYTRMNTLHTWDGGQGVTWNFTVPQDGLYAISLRCQVGSDRLPVYRSFTVDGEIPYAEMAAYKLDFNEDFQILTLSADDGEPLYVYLDAGEHTLGATAVIGDYYDVLLGLQEIDRDLGELLLDIIMIIGANPDVNYDYKIEKSIPDIVERLNGIADALVVEANHMAAICGNGSLVESSLRSCASLVRRISRNVKFIQKYVGDLTNTQTTLATWQDQMEFTTLYVDTIQLGGEGEKLNGPSSIWKKLESTLRSFLISFYKDYDSVGVVETTDDEMVVLDVWMTTSTERAEIFKALCDESFTPQTGIAVQLNIMPAGQLNSGAVNALLLSLVSDSAPDVAIGVGAGTPVELAIREAAMDLSRLPGYAELAAQYVPNAVQVNAFNGGVYGLPATMDFLVMMYRKDILSEIGVSLPQSWEDVYNYTLPTLAQNNLNMYIPQNFNTFLYQHGGRFYTDDGLTSTLDTPQAHAAFREMVELYTKYGVPYTTNFYNRFKTGDTPMGIAGFGEYMSLTVGASNLAGKWGVALIPGTQKEDGSLNRSWGGTAVSSSAYGSAVGTSSVILADTDYPEEAWEFLKWWGSEKTQLAYALEQETRLGVGARYNTANVKAFAKLPWPLEDLEVILASFESFQEPFGVLGGYYTNRHITNAWNALITGTTDDSVYDLIDQANENIQNELNDKQNEYRHLLDGTTTGVNGK